MRLINWNIDSLHAALQGDSKRAHQSRQVLRTIAQQKYDVVGLQEIKLPPQGLTSTQQQLLHQLFPNYRLTLRPAQPPARKSYGGELFLYRANYQPQVVLPRLTVPAPLNEQRRLLALDFPKFYLLQVYSPNAGQHLEKATLHHRWNQQLIQYVRQVRQNKPIIVVGDFSMVDSSLDVADAEHAAGQAGFTSADMADFHALLSTGLVDAFRFLHPQTTAAYSWWPQVIRTSK